MQKTKGVTTFFLVFFTLLLCSFAASAKDNWIRVNSKNFHLIGNASEKDIRKAATKLEQFRETFRLLFSSMSFDAAIPTNVIVFKSGSSYKPFKPRRADGKIDEFVAGYFQPGRDVNYITLSTEGEDDQTYRTIFHEYVHFMLNINFGKSEIPTWFNEGLAEYYETFIIEKDQEVKLGLFHQRHIDLLRDTKILPLDTLFNISRHAWNQSGGHSRSIYYAQSWALMHYLMQSSNGSKREGLGKFIAQLARNIAPEKAFQESFQMNYADMEKELKKYVSQASYQYQIYTFKNKLVFDTEMKVSPLAESDANAYLGDLLVHIRRADEAETYLQKALALDPNSSLANTVMGMVKFQQRKYDQAKPYLEKAIAGEQTNHIAYYNYALLLSREGRDDFGYVSSFESEKVAKMRNALNKAIAINPAYTESYELLAFINLVKNEQLDESVQLLKKALNYQPGDQQIILRIAEILSRQEKFDDAKYLAEKISKTADEEETRSRAESILSQIQSMRDFKAQNDAFRKQYEERQNNAPTTSGSNPPGLTRRTREKEKTPEEIAKAREVEKLLSINQALKKPAADEKQLIGRITKIACVSGKIQYTVKTETGTVSLSSKDFQNLALVSFESGAENAQVGCNSSLEAFNSVLTYKPSTAAKSSTAGELVAIDFVPDNFRFVEEKESLAIAEEPGLPPPPSENVSSTRTIVTSDKPEDFEARRREAMMESLRRQLRQPQEGETRDLGIIDKIECDKNGMYFVMKSETQLLKLKAPQGLPMRAYSPEISGVQFGCGMKQFDVPAVFTYKTIGDKKAKINGELVSMEFVPKSFKLN